MSDDAKAMTEWITAVSRELGLEGSLDSDATVDLVLDLTSDVAHGVSRPAAPVTAFLIGVAAGRADDPTVAARDFAGKVSKLAEGWDADTERAVPANDQDARG
ncbi:MAG: DUF6457 domain-containing protein [Pseudonocardia sp.]|nr:DUF6457 domain-containing protein [Pseudonocardia sp.]